MTNFWIFEVIKWNSGPKSQIGLLEVLDICLKVTDTNFGLDIGSSLGGDSFLARVAFDFWFSLSITEITTGMDFVSIFYKK